MKQTLYQQEYVTINLEDSVPVIYEEWLGAVTDTEFQKTLEKKLDLFIENKEKYEELKWMVNLRGLKVGKGGQNWANNEFHPRLYPVGVRKIAFVVHETALYLLQDFQLSPHMDSKKQIELCYFDSIADASEWIKRVPIAESF